MKITAELYGRPIEIELGPAAVRALMARGEPVLVEMELIFSCFVAKRACVRDPKSGSEGTTVYPGLRLDFRATMADTCDLTNEGGQITHTHTPLENVHRYVPGWCRIDHKNGAWSCEFGYGRRPPGAREPETANGRVLAAGAS